MLKMDKCKFLPPGSHCSFSTRQRLSCAPSRDCFQSISRLLTPFTLLARHRHASLALPCIVCGLHPFWWFGSGNARFPVLTW